MDDTVVNHHPHRDVRRIRKPSYVISLCQPQQLDHHYSHQENNRRMKDLSAAMFFLRGNGINQLSLSHSTKRLSQIKQCPAHGYNQECLPLPEKIAVNPVRVHDWCAKDLARSVPGPF